MLTRERRLTAYLWSVVLLAVPVVALTSLVCRHDLVRDLSGPHALVVLVIMGILIVGELFPIPIARGEEAGDEITVSSTFGMVLLLLAAAPVALIAQALALTLDEAWRRRQWSRLAFNVAQYSLSLIACRFTYAALAGEPFSTSYADLGHLALGPALAAAFVLLVINNGFVCVAVALRLRSNAVKIWNQDLKFHIAVAAPLIGLAPVIAQAVTWTPWSLVVLLTPIVALHRSGHLAMRREQESLRDPLTHLGNRTLLQSALSRTLATSSVGSAVLLIDLDHFKEINDTLGHAFGDQVLVEVSHRLRNSVGDDDLVARLGGDEFAILARCVPGPAEAEALACRVIASLRDPVQVGDVMLDVQGSVGIALAPEHADSAAELLRVADVALYAAKRDRGRYSLYERDEDVHSLARLGLQGELRRALEDPDDRQLWLAYQPQVDLRTGRIEAVECLLRWEHPALGPLAPDVFIPIAENTGLMDLLTCRVLDMGLSQLRAWDQSGIVTKIAVNLSARHLADLTWPEVVAAALSRHGVAPERLVLEVTESRLMTDPDRAAGVIRRLTGLGVELSIDDFGTGYSSLAYLQRLAVDEIKIDRTFIAALQDDAGNATIVRSTMDLGHGLGLRIVAEGVEDAETAALLSDWGCDILQGYYIGRPVPAAQLEQVLRQAPVSTPRRRPVPLSVVPEPLTEREVSA